MLLSFNEIVSGIFYKVYNLCEYFVELGINYICLCIVCLNGIFGEGCNFICGYCYGNSVCDKVNGSCVSGCVLGWIGIVCNKSE